MKKRMWIFMCTMLLFVGGCASQFEGKERYSYSSEKASAKQENQIHETILQQNDYEPDADFVAIEHHEILQIDETEKEMVVYARVSYVAYNRDLEADHGIQSPVRITYKKDGDKYKLEEYWIPLDGSMNEPSIRKAFPKHLVERAMAPEFYDEKKAEKERLDAKKLFEEKDKHQHTSNKT